MYADGRRARVLYYFVRCFVLNVKLFSVCFAVLLKLLAIFAAENKSVPHEQCQYCSASYIMQIYKINLKVQTKTHNIYI